MRTPSPSSTTALSGTSTLQGSTASLAGLQAAATKDPKAAIKETAKQFESIFMQELLKSMRASVQSEDGMMSNSGTQMGTEMLDQQYATKLGGRPGGLGDMIARQLERQLGGANTVIDPASVPSRWKDGHRVSGAAAAEGVGAASSAKTSSAQTFVERHTADAEAAEKATGIPASFILGQAAHESGWGKKQIMHADGTTSHNLFGIKAGSEWKGQVAEVTTTEYINGRAQKVVAKFRAYDSYESAFKDYAQLLKNNPRYSQVATASATPQAFAKGLQKAGYATDPAYADKLSRVINTTLRLQRGLT